MLLIAGGSADPNILALVQRARERRLPVILLLLDPRRKQDVTWDLQADALVSNSRPLSPTALFLRHDVFTWLRDRKPETERWARAWYALVLGWGLAHDHVRMFNRRYGGRQTNKLEVLHVARSLRIPVPHTLGTTNFGQLAALGDHAWVRKPVPGGGYCETVDDPPAGDRDRAYSDEPYIVQHRLVSPDLRIYRIGRQWFGFRILSEALDYRVNDRLRSELVECDDDLVQAVFAMSDRFGLDFTAADFKWCPETGRFLFLEINSSPMFAGLDRVANGRIIDAILDHLTGPEFGPEPGRGFGPEPGSEPGRD